MSLLQKLDQLIAQLNQHQHLSIAISGGIDSMLLCYLAHAYSNANVLAVHAASPAVPKAAFERVKRFASEQNWSLKVIDANEFSDPDYLKNPANRCYFCKSNLYSRVSSVSVGAIASGTNLDDLSDYRPGLQAAKEHKVIHPYVDAQLKKSDIYALAEHFNITDLERLPAQPCLASRVETGLSIVAEDLDFIDRCETQVRTFLPNITDVRTRITHSGVYVELSELPPQQTLIQLSQLIKQICQSNDYLFAGVRLYQKGSAFLTEDKFYEAV